jgi:non-ribosomal peptide synthetase component F
VWTVLLGRWSGQDDVVFGTAADLRRRPELEAMVGYCLTPLVVRTSLEGDPTFEELVVRSRNVVLDGLDHLVPFERIVRRLGRENDRGANPVYQTMLVLEPPAAPADPRWSLHQMEAQVGDAMGSTRLDLELELDERSDGHLAGRLIYDSDLFDRETIVRLAGHLSQIISGVGADPGLPISQVPLLTDEEAQRQIVEWNATASVAEDGRQSVAELIARHAHQDADAPALVVGGQPMTRGALQARPDADGATLRGEGAPRAAAASVRALIDEVGIGPADTVIVLDEMWRRVPEVALWPALAAGARVVLASPEDAMTGNDLSHLIRADGATLMYADPPTWQALVDSGLRASRTLRALSGPGRLERDLAGEILARCRVLFHGHGGAQAGGMATLGLVRGDGPVTIGRPVTDCRAYVLDRHDRAMPVGLAGELMLAGHGVGDGTTEDPFAGGPAVRTGERARWLADGRIELL